MSSAKGNTGRSRPQKYKNKSAFKNNLHDTSHTTKFINSIQVSDVCMRCKDIIEWKIKYKKYKPLTQPGKCVKCEQKAVRKAYHTICKECGKKLQICTKCCKPKDIIPAEPDKREQLKLDQEMQQLLQMLPERKRRTFLRYMNKKNKDPITEGTTSETQKKDLVDKLNALKVDAEDDDDDDDFNSSDDSDSNDSQILLVKELLEPSH